MNCLSGALNALTIEAAVVLSVLFVVRLIEVL